MHVNWKGVIPAITTPFDRDLTVDHGFLAQHSRWLVDDGCAGLVPIGSLGEVGHAEPAEKRRHLETCVKAWATGCPSSPASRRSPPRRR